MLARDVPFFGELYRRTTEPLLSAEVTRAEGRYLREGLKLSPDDRLVDVGCGSGRHLAELAQTGASLVGVDIDEPSLKRASAWARVVQADMRALPFADESFTAAVCWYSTLFIFDDEQNLQALAEVARVLAKGGRMVMQTVNPERLAAEPCYTFERRLPDGSVVRESSRFDVATGLDEGARLLELPSGEVLRGRYRLRYYRPGELARMFEHCGLRIVRLHGSILAEAFDAQSPELIAWAVRE